MRTIEAAQHHIDNNNLWRAKEILAGSLPTLGYNLELYEKLGTVLLSMGDLPEAGRFLFLSGAREDRYIQAIDIYLNKYSRNGIKQFFTTFPHKARLARLSEYPDSVMRELKEIGFPEELVKIDNENVNRSKKSDGRIAWITCVVIGGIVFGLMMLGIRKLIEMLS